jgi:uncharacterized protein with gpF-like domain
MNPTDTLTYTNLSGLQADADAAYRVYADMRDMGTTGRRLQDAKAGWLTAQHAADVEGWARASYAPFRSTV